MFWTNIPDLEGKIQSRADLDPENFSLPLSSHTLMEQQRGRVQRYRRRKTYTIWTKLGLCLYILPYWMTPSPGNSLPFIQDGNCPVTARMKRWLIFSLPHNKPLKRFEITRSQPLDCNTLRILSFCLKQELKSQATIKSWKPWSLR